MDDEGLSVLSRRVFQERLRSGLVARPVVEDCKHCGKGIPSSLEWICGYCGFENRRTSLYSFLHQCQRCDRAPKSYVCPHCEKRGSLDADDDLSSPARFGTNKPVDKPSPPPDAAVAKRQQHAREIEELDRQIEKAKKEAELARIKGGFEKPAEESQEERMLKLVREYVQRVMGGYMAVDACRAELAEKYKDNPARLAQANEALAAFLEDNCR